MANPIIHHWAGRNYRTIWMVDNEKVLINVMNAELNAVGVEVSDGVAGELRTRNYFILDHYSLKLELQQTKLEALKAVFKMQEAVDGLVVPLQSAVGFSITFNDGTKDTLVVQDISVDAWGLTLPSRTDRNKFSLPMRANIAKFL